MNNIFSSVAKKRVFQKDTIMNMGFIGVSQKQDYVLLIPDTSQTKIKSLFMVHRKNKGFKFLDSHKGELDNKVYYFSSFIGFFDHEGFTFLIFAEKVQVKHFGNYMLYKIVSVVAMELRKLRRNKGLSVLLTEYYGNNFYFSFHVDLTHSLNFQKILDQKLKNQLRLNWLFFANRNNIIHCIRRKAPSYEEWAVPIVNGYFFHQ